MQVLMTILYILLFIVFLSVLIIIHELGHLAAAKAFNVYCLEYSVGMGPALFKYKRKDGETQFTLRGIPFGGYVSMYGEGVELPEGVTVDESRSLNGIKPWKRAIVLLAGVTMNALLALVFFAISNVFPQNYWDYVNHVSVAESISGIDDGGYIKFEEFKYHDDAADKEHIFYLADNQTIFDDNDSVKYATCFNFESLNSFKKMDLSNHIYFYSLKEGTKITTQEDGTEIQEVVMVPDFDKYVSPSTFTKATVHFTTRIPDPENNEKHIDGNVVAVDISQVDGKVQSFGLSIYYETIQYDFGEVVTHTFSDFGNCSVALFRAIGDLFTKKNAWENIGGIVAVGFETTSVLQNYGFGKFLFYWGFISVNLAIFNLLPFPGLDGWQLLVLGVEVVFRKKIPEKVKNIVSLIGLGLLLGLMVVVLAKDLWVYIFKGMFGL